MSTTLNRPQDAETPQEKAVYRKVTVRLLPLLMICYLFAYLDRTNIGFAKIQMQQELPFLTEAVFGLGAGIFFLAYACLEIPSNMLMNRIGARRTITRIMVLWGLASTAMLFVNNEVSFYVLRALLGVFEAGFAPGIILFFTYWFPARRMGRIMGLFAMAGPLGAILGSTSAGLIIEYTHDAWGLSGWQWMFLIQGLPAAVLGILFWFFIPDNALQAKWLNDSEKSIVVGNIEKTKEGHHDSKFLDALKNPAIYVMSLAYFGIMCGIYAVAFWLPTILHNGGIEGNVLLGFATALPSLLVLPVLWVVTRSSDRSGDRFWRSLIPTLLAAVGLTIAAYTSGTFGISYVALCVAICSVQAAYAVFWSVPTTTLGGTAAAGGIAFINTFGILGGFVAPTIMGFVQEATGSSRGGLMTMVGMLLISALAIVILPRVMKKPM